MKKLLLGLLLMATCFIGNAQDTAHYKAESYVIYVGDSSGQVTNDSTHLDMWTEDTLRVISIGKETYYVDWDADRIQVRQIDDSTTLYIFFLYKRVTGDYYGKLSLVLMNDAIVIIGYGDGTTNKIFHVNRQ